MSTVTVTPAGQIVVSLAGAKGDKGDTGNPGSSALVWHGNWSASHTYVANDYVVNPADSLVYICISGHAPSHEPPNITYWLVICISNIPMAAYMARRRRVFGQEHTWSSRETPAMSALLGKQARLAPTARTGQTAQTARLFMIPAGCLWIRSVLLGIGHLTWIYPSYTDRKPPHGRLELALRERPEHQDRWLGKVHGLPRPITMRTNW
jgi:hypothetical protein